MLGFRWDPLVFGGDEIPARLGSPRWLADFAAKSRYVPRHLGIRHERGLFGVHVCSERGVKLSLIEEQKAVLRRQYRRYWRPWWRIYECGHRLAFIRSERRDVYETGHLRIVPGFSDYCSTVGVANENRRAVLCCQSPLGVRYVVVQRNRRILDDGDLVAVSRQDLVHGSPSRAVHKATVNQDNVVHHSHPPFLKVNGYFASDP
jgi:hypothetical protein